MHATDDDIANIGAWAELIGHVLDLVPQYQRDAVLARLALRDKLERRGDRYHLVNLAKRPLADPLPAMRLKGLIVQIFVHEIVTHYSRDEAAAMLFADQPCGHGSQQLADYLDLLAKHIPNHVARGWLARRSSSQDDE